MITGSRYTDVEMFASAIEDMFEEIDNSVMQAAEKAVDQSARKTAKCLRNSKLSGRKPWSAEYIGGFASHSTKGAQPVGEVGNKAKPGLVHLLEKGHATLTGRRTQAYPHMKPALAEMEIDFEQRMASLIGAALKG